MAQGPRKNFTQFKAVLQPAIPGRSLADFRIYASYRGVPGQFYGTLKVVRLTDKRVLFPFEGCPEIGLFPDRQAAVDAAQQYGEQFALVTFGIRILIAPFQIGTALRQSASVAISKSLARLSGRTA
jgi:hypothetical protein